VKRLAICTCLLQAFHVRLCGEKLFTASKNETGEGWRQIYGVIGYFNAFYSFVTDLIGIALFSFFRIPVVKKFFEKP
jgi:hypothetical protein